MPHFCLRVNGLSEGNILFFFFFCGPLCRSLLFLNLTTRWLLGWSLLDPLLALRRFGLELIVGVGMSIAMSCFSNDRSLFSLFTEASSSIGWNSLVSAWSFWRCKRYSLIISRLASSGIRLSNDFWWLNEDFSSKESPLVSLVSRIRRRNSMDRIRSLSSWSSISSGSFA